MTTATEEVWFILLQGEQLGPLSLEEVLDFYYKDVVTIDSLLWREGWTDWVQIVHIPEFKDLLFKGVIIEEAAAVNQSPEDATAFLEQQNFQSLNSGIASTPQFMNGQVQVELDEADLLEELEELESIEESIQNKNVEQAQVIHAPQISLASKKVKKSGSGLKVLMSLIFVSLGLGAFYLQPWKEFSNPSNPYESLSNPHESLSNPSEIQTTTRQESRDQQLNTADQSTQISDLSPDPVNLPLANDQGLALALPESDKIVEDLGVTQTPDQEFPVPQNQDVISPGIEEIELDIETPFEVETEKKPINPTTELNTKKSQSTSQTPAQENTKKTQHQKRSSKPTSTQKRNEKKTQTIDKVVRKAPQTNKETEPKKSTNTTERVTLRRDDLKAVLNRERAKFNRCISIDPNLKGTVNVMVVIQRDGSVSSAKATSSKLRKSSANECIISSVKTLNSLHIQVT